MANYQTQSQQSPKAILKTLPIIHIALLLGQVLFCIVVFAIQKQTPKFDISNTADPFLFVVPVMAIACFAISNFLFRQQLTIAAGKPTVAQKIQTYQAASIVRFAPLEGASLFGIVTYMLTGNLLFISISGLIILYFIFIRPTKDKIVTGLNLDYQEKAELDNNDVPIKY